MMRALIFNPILISPRIALLCSSRKSEVSFWKEKSIICCQGIGSVTTSASGLSPILSDRGSSAPTTTNALDRGTTLMDVESPGLSQNGKAQEDKVIAEDLISYDGLTSANVMEATGGIGIVRFLKGKCFLITGATGFVAKVLIEKILRTVPDVGKIYVLIKSKSNEAAMERLKTEIINAELFKRLKEVHGKSYQSFMLKKLIPVAGNVCESSLGIEASIVDEIANEVDIIVNSAANTTFDERYDIALKINTRGPCHLMNLAKRCKKIKLFLQVSTAYVNGQRQGRILERPFGVGDRIARDIPSVTSTASLPKLDVEFEMKMALDIRQSSQDTTIAQRMKELGLERARLYGWQDTYVFTKAMGEMLIDTMRGEIPVVIIRPSVIESTFGEPFSGWMEGNRMMDPIVLYYGKGQLTGFLVDPKGVLDVVPADMVVNAMLAAMAKHGAAENPGMNVYQIASSVVNPLIFQDLAKHMFEHFSSSPYLDSRGRPIHVSKMKLFDSMDEFSSHISVEAYQRSERVAAAAASKGKLSKRLEIACRKSVEQAKYLANIYEPYTFYGGRFDNTNSQKLMEEMSEEEQKSFGFDVGSIDWRDYISNVHIPGLRRHVLKGRGMC
ncbi:hypothetical protein Syun_017082 [Stephania yunnanensis]|uniref:Fatty acyl-CoA reductase n=1 Tax=Stephania yunnanensis TaxID=152371 RepID=A0AAP0J773_9MAGN